MERNEYNGWLEGSTLGWIEEADLEPGQLEWGEFMPIRVKIDVTKPLMRKKKLNIGYLEPMCISFSYERTPDFCYWCWIIGHGHTDYEQWPGRNNKELEEPLSYGNWLQAGQQGNDEEGNRRLLKVFRQWIQGICRWPIRHHRLWMAILLLAGTPSSGSGSQSTSKASMPGQETAQDLRPLAAVLRRVKQKSE